MSNGILKYTSRDYDSIKTDLTESISALTDLWTSREDSDPGIVLIKQMSALGDMLSYNFDKQALEYYSSTVTQRKNAAKLLNLVGYNMRWYQSALTTVTLTYNPAISDELMWVTYCIQGALAETDEERLNAYYDYRNRFVCDVRQASIHTLSIPPIIDNNGNIEVPNWLDERYTWVIDGEPYIDAASGTIPESIKNDRRFKINCTKSSEFIKGCKAVIEKFSEKVGTYPLHTYVNDINRNIELYPTDSSGVTYSLIPLQPTSQQMIDASNRNFQYDPSIELQPFIPYKMNAIQGYLTSVTFNNTQLKNNRFYLPDTAVDDTYMYLSYDSTLDSGTGDKKVGFAVKTDNLITVIKVEDSDNNDILYFQFGVDDYDYPYIELVSYWNTMFAESSVQFTLYYFRSAGRNGNITTNYLSRLSNASLTEIEVKNVDTNVPVYDEGGSILSKPGKNPQTAQDAYIDSINYIMTYNTLVTIYDFARFTKRQEGIYNAIVADKQYRNDLNKNIQKQCKEYSEEQLHSILGSLSDDMTKSEMINTLYRIKQVFTDYKNCPVTKDDISSVIKNEDVKPYTLNVYPVYGDYIEEDSDGDEVAWYRNEISTDDKTKRFPYKLYKIYTSNDPNVSSYNYKVATMLDEAYNNVHICNVEPTYTALRVFPWRCCCVLHLTKSVSKTDATQIVSNVISYLGKVYAVNNMEFGKKLKYMDVIQTIMDADDRIRYVDAGVGNKKLVEFEDVLGSGYEHYNTEAYFNPISLMRYVQTLDDNENSNASSYHYISVDPSYVQGGVTSDY